MSEALRVTCPCGYENWVPEEKRGQTVPCFICGQDIVAEEAAAQEPIDAAAPPAAMNAQSASSKPRSPFEADDIDTAVRPKFQHAPPTPTAAPAPAPRPRSPFEADAPEQDRILRADEKLVAGPFSLDAAPAPKDGPSVIDEMEKVRPKERRDRHMVVHTISPHDAPTGEKCAKCGKEMRGSWDRIETEAGTICYVCSNQATHNVPIRLKADTSPKREIRDTEFIIEPSAPAMPNESAPWWLDTKSDGFKRAILMMACGMLILAFYIFFFGDTVSETAQVAVSTSAPSVDELPGWARIVMHVWTALALVVTVFLSIYIALAVDERLPHETLFQNVVYIGAISVPLGVMHFLGIWSSALIAPLAYAGAVYPPLILLARWGVTILVLTNYFNMRFFSIVINIIVFNVIYLLVSFAFGSVLTRFLQTF